MFLELKTKKMKLYHPKIFIIFERMPQNQNPGFLLYMHAYILWNVAAALCVSEILSQMVNFWKLFPLTSALLNRNIYLA